MKKTVCLFILASLLCPLFSSCTQGRYKDTLTCEELANALREEILGGEEYANYSDEDIKYMFDEINFDSCSIIYSTSSDNIDEIGVFHAKDAESTNKLLDDTAEYIEDVKEEKSDFLRSYLPTELDKVDGARVKRYGNYVVYTILSEDTAEKVFDKTKKLLRE